MQVMQAQPPDLIGKDVARRLFIQLAAESSEDMLPLCKQIAELEDQKQKALVGLTECPGMPSGEIARLITQQQGQIILLKMQSNQSKGG